LGTLRSDLQILPADLQILRRVPEGLCRAPDRLEQGPEDLERGPESSRRGLDYLESALGVQTSEAGHQISDDLDRDIVVLTMGNIYFDLTQELNEQGPIAALASGQAVVFYRLALMSKDGDWILRETPEACARVLAVLAKYGAHYRPGAPLDLRWLAGGWSSHFEFFDPEGRRIRCDFVTRPPRLGREEVASLFAPPAEPTLVVGLEPLIRMKRTQRAKDYPVIGELARLLPGEREIEMTTDPDRVLALAPSYGKDSARPPVKAALAGRPREDVVVELARELDRMQQDDRARLDRYRKASESYMREFQAADIARLNLPEAHERICILAERLLPLDPLAGGPESWKC